MHEPPLARVHEPPPPPTRRELRAFALSVGGVLVALAAVGVWRGREIAPTMAGIAGVALIAAGLVAPGRLAGVHRAWMAVALAMSRFTTPLFMSVVFLAVLTPLGLVMRVAGHRPLARRRDAVTFWADRPTGARRSDLRRQF